ncbi:MAG: glycogen debranching enzyme GlgX, partial [Rhodoferax sp.]|nr:glycogen debranching enzyme GlgX [Rhodoferax sp.]
MATANPSVLSCDPGQSWPLGASCSVQGGVSGVNFAVYSRYAERMELCLFDAQGDLEIASFDLPACTEGVWHGLVASLGAGQCYGFRAHGSYKSPAGSRFNPKRLLLDPFARAVCGDTRWLA